MEAPRWLAPRHTTHRDQERAGVAWDLPAERILTCATCGHRWTVETPPPGVKMPPRWWCCSHGCNYPPPRRRRNAA